MRLAFFDWLTWDYDPLSVTRRPLGGTQSGVCYLTRCLAAQGHNVTLFNGVTRPRVVAGVRCLPLARVVPERFRQLSWDVVVNVNVAGVGPLLRDMSGPDVPLVLWAHHDADQPRVAKLAEETEIWDAYALISDYQKARYVKAFGIPQDRVHICRNAVAPAFTATFQPRAPILPSKRTPPTLVYTSTPYRGLDLLVEIFPEIRREVPGTTLEVYSSLEVYSVAAEKDRELYGALYDRCRSTEGVDYIGGVPQPELARRLRSARMLAYPSIFPETSCIAVMEAMVMGCQVVSTALGALPETCEGYALLVPPLERPLLKIAFTDAVVKMLQAPASGLEKFLQAQTLHFNLTCSWPRRAREWADWLGSLRG